MIPLSRSYSSPLAVFRRLRANVSVFLCVAVLAILISAMAAGGGHGASRNLGKGDLPISFEPRGAIKLAPDDEIIIEGRVVSRRATLVIRIDDRQTPSYRERSNEEYALRPGPFRVVVAAKELSTSGGRALDIERIHRIIAFSSGKGGTIEASRFAIKSAATRHVRTLADRVSFGTGATPIRYIAQSPVDARGMTFHIAGYNKSETPQKLLLRVDDQQSHDYSSRANIERTIPPGPFRMEVAADGLSTPRGRVLDAAGVRLVVVTPWPETPDIKVDQFELLPVAQLPNGAQGFSFGAADAGIPAGFERVAPGDERLSGRAISVRRRPKPDPLVANGLRGVDTIRLKVRPGTKRVTIWSEDPGEWNHLPAARDRRITVNGKTLLADDLSPSDWLEKVYLAGGGREHTVSMDAWTAFGQYRGDARSIEVKAPSGDIIVRLDGRSLDDQFINAVLIEPAGSPAGLNFVNEQRAAWYRNNWRIAPAVQSADAPETARAGKVFAYTLDVTGPADRPAKTDAPVKVLAPAAVRLAPGTGGRITLAIRSTGLVGKPAIEITSPVRVSSGGGRERRHELSVKAWAGQWRYDLVEPQHTVLTLRDDLLRADLGSLPISGDRLRRYEIWLSAGDDAGVGKYGGGFDITLGGERFRIPIDVEVIDTVLPKPAKPAGFYLTYPPHLDWFGQPQSDANRQAACDMNFMRGLGLRGTAPPVTVPYRGGTERFETEMSAAQRAGLEPAWLVYNPIHHLRASYGSKRAAKFAAGANDALGSRGIPPPVWSAADEPSNPDQSPDDLRAWTGALRAADPEIRLAGHLNSPQDENYAGLFDVVVINHGFGIDRPRVGALAESGRAVWYYNTFRPRLTAGMWLHLSGARRYVQWHARMPTANPFDPIDGREGDVQVLYPSDDICEETPDIHRNLLLMAEGVVDQRWLKWLVARSDHGARELYQRLDRRAGKRWEKARQLTARDLNVFRDQILQLASPSD